jgi:hypothetical protein
VTLGPSSGLAQRWTLSLSLSVALCPSLTLSVPLCQVDVQLLYREDMIELYLEGYLMVVYSIFNATGSMTNGSVGLFNANGGEGTARYKLTLPAIASINYE